MTLSMGRGARRSAMSAGNTMGRSPKGSGGWGLVCFVIIEPAVSLPEIGERIFCLFFAARLSCPRGAKVNPKHPHRKKPRSVWN
jgi:hypothetical protein